MKWTQFGLHLFQCRKQRPFRAAGTQSRRPWWDVFKQCIVIVVGQGRLQAANLLLAQAQIDTRHTSTLDKAGETQQGDLARVFTGHWHDVLAVNPGLHIGPAQHSMDTLLHVFGLPFFEHQHLLLANAEVDQLIRYQRVGHVHHINRNIAVAERITQALAL